MALVGVLVVLAGGCDGDAAAPIEHDDGKAVPHGSHGGRLLEDDDFTLELGLFENGVPAEFRAWASSAGEPIAPTDLSLVVTLHRLGGEVEQIPFTVGEGFLRGLGSVREPHSFEVEVLARHRGQSHLWRYASFEGRTRITERMAREFGVEVEPAGPGVIEESIRVYGTVRSNAETGQEIRARFPGLVRRVAVSVGAGVERGDLLAEVESDASLGSYPITAAAPGLISERDVNPGEHTDGRTLFRLVDPSTVWAEFAVFPAQMNGLTPGLAVRATSAAGEDLGGGSLSWIDAQTAEDQSVRVRAVLDNEAGRLRPGLHLTGTITLASHEVALAVRRSALQSFREATVVFARVGDEYEVRMLELGRSDANRVEVLGGLAPGELYVVSNSYLIKADIEKSGAAHEH
jgi:cobalt-zinc-cadmium efflux system membrane fusion protein